MQIALTDKELALVQGGDWISTTLHAVGGALWGQVQININNGLFVVTSTTTAGAQNGIEVNGSYQYLSTWLAGYYQMAAGGIILASAEAYDFIDQVVS